MADFVNEFSWSKSRHDLFNDCRRKYFYNYYASWNGWKRESSERCQELYRLKKLQSRQMWIGSAVHSAIEKCLKKHRDNLSLASFEEQKKALLEGLRFDFSLSREGRKSRPPWRLFEHEYDSEIADEEWKKVADLAIHCFENFWKSEIYEKVKTLNSEDWLEVEEFSHFHIDGVKIHVVLDFSYKKDGKVFIYDWKTGQSASSNNSLQLACYRIYASEKWAIDPENVLAVEALLATGENKEHHMEGVPLEETLKEIRASIGEMKSYLRNTDNNTSKKEEDFEVTEDAWKCDYCNFKKLCTKFN